MRHSVITSLLLLSLLAPPARAQSVPQLTQGVVAGGGGVSAQGPLRVEGTVGQGVVATSSGGAFSVDGGFDITFHPVNAPPTANGQSVTADENTPLSITLTGTDEETPAGSLVFTLTAQPTHGALSGTAPNLTYTPAGGYVGPDSFKFTVTDTGDGTAPPLTSAEATVSVNVVLLPTLHARDARLAEPPTGQAQMLFTLTLSRVATSPVSVAFNTSALPAGTGAATAGSDYTTNGGTATFQPGQSVRTVAVPVLHDAAAEPDETFLLQLSSVSGAHLGDGEAAGTITSADPPGSLLITELRTSGPGGAGDDFVEVYNNSDAPVNVQATDASAGWALVASNNGCAADPVVVGVIPSGTTIPARGHYLFVGSQYSLADYGGTGAAAGDKTLSADLAPDANVALFSVADLAGISSTTRLDAVGFGANTGDLCDLTREGTTLPAASGSTQQYAFVRKFTLVAVNVPTPTDSNNNSADFYAVSTTPSTPVSAAVTTPVLGAPGPENRTGPNIKKFSQIGAQQLDTTKPSSAVPNRVRRLCSDPLVEECHAARSSQGTISIRRTFVNTTGGPVTRLRFRLYLVNTYTAPSVPAGTADLRAITSGPTTATVTGAGVVTVNGTTLEETPVPVQALGGGMNSSLSVPDTVISLADPLPNNASVSVQFLFGVQQGGAFSVLVYVEALP